MPIDRSATLKQAEKLLRQGKLDGAIAEYVQLVGDQPGDWNSINALGDLYVRAGDNDRAVAQFTQVADHLFTEGFLPKAGALYRKALKLKPDHEPTLLRLSEVAAQQGLLADARTYLGQIGRQRRGRGDEQGAADCLVRLALLDEADAEAKLTGAHAAQALGDATRATALFKEAAEEFVRTHRQAEAVDALAEAAVLDPSDVELQRQVARECIAAGQLERAGTYLTLETGGSDPVLLIELARIGLAAGNESEARAVFARLMAVAPAYADRLLHVAGEIAANGEPEVAFHCAEIVVDDALLASDWERAFGALHAFLAHVAHIPALMKLVEIAIDAGRDDVMYEAQIRLVDACLDQGRGADARVIAEDLVVRDPASAAHADRLRRALGLLGVADANAVVDRYRQSPDAGAISGTDAVLPSPAPAAVAAQAQAPPVNEATPARGAEMLEIDLSDALAGLEAVSMEPEPLSPPAAPVVRVAQDLESAFDDIRARGARDQHVVEAAEHYERGLQKIEDGLVPEGLAELQCAARAPLFRFRASAQIGRLHAARGDFQESIDWLERAAEAPAPSPDEGLAVLYELAEVLERSGESARALAVLLEIESDRSSYRDVPQRIEQLTRAQAGRGA